MLTGKKNFFLTMKMPESQVLWQGMSEQSVEYGPSILV